MLLDDLRLSISRSHNWLADWYSPTQHVLYEEKIGLVIGEATRNGDLVHCVGCLISGLPERLIAALNHHPL